VLFALPLMAKLFSKVRASSLKSGTWSKAVSKIVLTFF